MLARLALTIALLAAVSAAQDLSGTWLKGTLVTRLMPSGGIDLVGGGPDLDAQVATVKRRAAFYLQIQDQLDASSYQVEAFAVVDGQLGPTCAFGTLQLFDGGVFTIEDLLVPIEGENVDEESGPAFGYAEGDVVGRLRVKVDGEGSVKKLALVTRGGVVDDALLVDGETVTSHVGGMRVKLKFVEPAKLPPVDATAKVGPS